MKNEIIKINSEVDQSVVYDLPIRDDLFCLNCKVPSFHHRLYPDSIGCVKSGNDWHLTCKGTTIALIPPHVIKEIFESLKEAYKIDKQTAYFNNTKRLEIEMTVKEEKEEK